MSNQLLTDNLKKPQNQYQALGYQLKFQGLLKPGDIFKACDQNPPNKTLSILDNLTINQAFQRDYLELQKNYQNLIKREQLLKNELRKPILQMTDPQLIGYMANIQRLYKQLQYQIH